MKKLQAVFMVLVLAGCASTTVFENEDGSYSLVTTSSSESYAVSEAKEDAEEKCQKLGKKFVLVDKKTTYQGADKTAKAVVGAVGVMTGKGYHDGSRHDDYKVEMKFKCK